jgi:hypothetical protein
MPIESSNQPQIITLENWPQGGINQSTRRSAIGDNDLWWIENYVPLADGELRSAWGPSAPLWTAPSGTTILRQFNMNMSGTQPQAFLFLSDGTVQVVNLNPPHTTQNLGALWNPVAPDYKCDMKLWNVTIVGNTTGQIGGALIGSPRGLYAIDANLTITPPGATAPNWLTGGAVDASGNPFPMPSGLPGIFSMEVYNQRLWVMGQTVISFSAPQNGANFSAAGGGGSFSYFGDKLTVSFTDLYQTAGFLYVIGDSMTDWISNIQLVGQPDTSTSANVTSPFTTQFQLSNYNPQIGERFFRPVGAWLQAFAVFDLAGTYLIDGSGQTTWFSQKVLNTWMSLNPTPFIPTSSPVHIFSQRWLLFNGTFTDPWKVQRSLILAWNGQIWTAFSQRYNLSHISHYEQDSCIQAYGTDGSVMVQLFAQPDPTLEKRLSTKAYAGRSPLEIKEWKRAFVQMQDIAGQPEGSFITGSLSTAGGGIPNGSEQLSFEVQPNINDVRPHPTRGQGLFGWLDLTGNSPDYIIERILIAYDARTLFGA